MSVHLKMFEPVSKAHEVKEFSQAMEDHDLIFQLNHENPLNLV